MDGQDSQDTGTYRALESVIARLLGPGGCPWDREQTHQSLKRYLLEECYELMEAIEDGDPKHMIEELGDVLVQVAFHIQLAQNEGAFGPREVFASVNDKLVRRHPHVFGNSEASTAEQVKATWEDVKQRERLLIPPRQHTRRPARTGSGPAAPGQGLARGVRLGQS